MGGTIHGWGIHGRVEELALGWDYTLMGLYTGCGCHMHRAITVVHSSRNANRDGQSHVPWGGSRSAPKHSDLHLVQTHWNTKCLSQLMHPTGVF